LRFVYPGNLPGQVGDLENTCCSTCGETVVERFGYFVRSYRIAADGTCPSCAAAVPGRWSASFDGQITSRPFVPGSRSRLVTLAR
jgi:pyruvate formate lyase activating enzyme